MAFSCHRLKWNVLVHFDWRIPAWDVIHALKLKGAYAGVGRIKSASRKVDEAKEKFSVRSILIVKVDLCPFVPLIVFLVLGDLVCLKIDQCETLCDQVSEHEGLQAES